MPAGTTSKSFHFSLTARLQISQPFTGSRPIILSPGLKPAPPSRLKTILSHFGLSGPVVAQLPLNLEDKADKPEKILRLAKFLFTPEIARRIEARSAEERRKVIDYLRPLAGRRLSDRPQRHWLQRLRSDTTPAHL